MDLEQVIDWIGNDQLLQAPHDDWDGTCFEAALPLGEAGPHDLTMLDSADRLPDVVSIGLITPFPIGKDCDSASGPAGQLAAFVVRDPHESLRRVIHQLRPPIPPRQCNATVGVAPSAQIHPSASIHPTAQIGEGVRVDANTVVMAGAVVMPHCRIGSDALISPGVTIYAYSEIGNRVRILAGSVIGADGFGYHAGENGHELIPQLGYVVIEDDVDVGAAVTIDRATYGTTRIGCGTKIDNQVMIAHNCQIGKRNLICSQVGIAGSCRTGDGVILAGQVGLKDHITLGDNAIVGAQAGVMDNLDGNEVYLGSPATKQRDQMQIMAVERRLPEMRRELKSLRKQVASLASSSNMDVKRGRNAA